MQSMNSHLSNLLRHPIYSLALALFVGLASAGLTPILFFDASHRVTWFDIGLFSPVVLVAASAIASKSLILRNRQIGLYLLGYLPLLWHLTAESLEQTLIKGVIVAIVVTVVVHTSTPIFDDWKREILSKRLLGVLSVIIGSLFIAYLDGKLSYISFAEQFLPAFIAILSARIFITWLNIDKTEREPFQISHLIPVALFIGQLLFVNLAPDAFLRPGIVISLALLAAAITLPYRLFSLFLPIALIMNAVEFSISPYTQTIVTDRVLLTLAMVAFVASFIALKIRQLNFAKLKLIQNRSELEQAVNRFEKVSAVSEIALFEQMDAQGSLWSNQQLNNLLGIDQETNLSLQALLDKISINDQPARLEDLTPLDDQPFRSMVSINDNAMAAKKVLLTANVDQQGFLFGSLIDQTDTLERGLIALKAKRQAEQFEKISTALMQTLEQAAEKSGFDLATVHQESETIHFAFKGHSVNFPSTDFAVHQLVERVKPSHKEAINYLLQGKIDSCEIPLNLSKTETIWWKIDRIGVDPENNDNLFIQDISLEKRNQDRVLKSRSDAELAIRKLNITTDTSGIGLFEIDPINEKVRPSATLREILDLPVSEFISIKGFLGLFDEENDSEFKSTLLNLYTFKGPKHFNVTIDSQNGKRYFDITMTSQGLLSVDRQILGSIIETTDRQRLIEESKELLHQANLSFVQLQERFESEKRLFGIIAHEIRTPVSAIKMMLEDDSDHSLEINQSVNHLLNLIDDLRNVVKPEQQTARQRKTGRISQTLLEVCNSMQISAKEAQIDLVVSELDWEDPETYFDTTSLKQMLINFLRNAFIHSEASQVSVDLYRPTIDTNIVNYTIKISDNGQGIPKEYQANIFNAYYRGDSKADGSGIGLYLCRQIAHELGGTIQYEDTPGGGATFLINLAVDLISTDSGTSELDSQKTSEPKESTQSTKALDLTNKRVLVAEDNLMIRTLTKKMIEGLGAEVVAQEDGQLALAAAKEGDFDLVVTDIFMPNLDGYGLVSALREIGFSGPIVGVSAATIGEERDRLIEAGASAALAKPISVEKLTEALQSIDQQNQSL